MKCTGMAVQEGAMGGVRKHLGCASMEAQEGGVAVSGRVQGLQAWQRKRGGGVGRAEAVPVKW